MSKVSKAELLACPFCKGEASIWERDTDWMGDMALGCNNRKCHIYPTVDFRDENGGKERAIGIWNTRAQPEAESGELEKLRELSRAVVNAWGKDDRVYKFRSAMADLREALTQPATTQGGGDA